MSAVIGCNIILAIAIWAVYLDTTGVLEKEFFIKKERK